MCRTQGVSRAQENPGANLREAADIPKLRMEYEAGIKANEELRRLLESEREKNHGRSRLSDGMLRLNESARSDDEINRLRQELQNATQMNHSLGSRLKEVNESFSKLKGLKAEAVKQQKELQDAKRLNKTLTNQLKETRKSAEEIGRVRRELREAKTMNDQLGKQLADLLNHSAKMKDEVEK